MLNEHYSISMSGDAIIDIGMMKIAPGNFKVSGKVSPDVSAYAVIAFYSGDPAISSADKGNIVGGR